MICVAEQYCWWIWSVYGSSVVRHLCRFLVNTYNCSCCHPPSFSIQELLLLLLSYLQSKLHPVRYSIVVTVIAVGCEANEYWDFCCCLDRPNGVELESSNHVGGYITLFTDLNHTSCSSADPSTMASLSKPPLCSSNLLAWKPNLRIVSRLVRIYFTFRLDFLDMILG